MRALHILALVLSARDSPTFVKSHSISTKKAAYDFCLLWYSDGLYSTLKTTIIVPIIKKSFHLHGRSYPSYTKSEYGEGYVS